MLMPVILLDPSQEYEPSFTIIHHIDLNTLIVFWWFSNCVSLGMNTVAKILAIGCYNID